MGTADPVLLQTAAEPVDSAGLRRILLNWAALLGAYVLPRGLTFASALVAARVLGPERFGAYGTAASYAIIVSIIATLGMMPLLVRELARAPERASELLAAAHVIKAVAAVLMMAASVLIATRVFHYAGDVVLGVTLLGIGYVFSGFAENLGAYFQALEQMRVWLEASIWFGLLSGALGIVLVVLTHSVAWFCLGFACGQLGSLLWLLRRLPPSVRVWSHAALSDAKHLVRAALPFGAAFFALTVFYKFDALLLNMLESTRVVGLYAAGYKLVDIAHALAVVASVAIYPRLARLTVASQRAQPAARALELFLLAGALAAGGLWLVRTPLTSLLFGDAYAVTADVLALLAPALVALTITILSGYLLSVADRVGVLAIAYTIAIALKLTLGLWLIPKLGAAGMAAAMVIAESALALILLYALARQALGRPRLSVFALAGGAGVIAALTHRLVPGEAWPPLLLYAVAVLAWYALGGAVSRAEWNMLLHALRGRTQAA